MSNGIFLLQLLSAVEARVVNWNLVTKGESGMFPATLYDGLVNNRITTISFNLMERPEGNRGNLVLHFINFYFFLLLVDSRLCQN